MKTVGVMLREARIAKGLTPADVERATKIREKYIRALEADDFRQLPSPSYAKGFVRNYAEFLGLSSDAIMAFFRRQTTEVTKASLIPKGVSDPLNKPLVHLTPGRFVGILVGVLLLLFFAYLGSQYVRTRQAPPLTVDTPKNNEIVKEGRVVVEGKTDPDASVTINGVSTIVRDDGRFYDRVQVEAGVNKITVTSTSRFGIVTSVVREVGFQP